PTSASAGTAFNFTVTAQDAFNNTATSYSGTVNFTSNDSNATLPGNDKNTTRTGTFDATLRTAGLRTITATDTANTIITDTSQPPTVSAAAPYPTPVRSPTSASAGTAFNFTVTAQDQFNNTATGYSGTVNFTSNDGQATLPG